MSTNIAPRQYCFFDLAADEELRFLQEQQAKLVLSSDAPNTLKAYSRCWRNFTRWCRNWRRDSLPTCPQALCEFVTWGAQLRKPAYKPATLQLAVAAIRRFHKDAGYADPVDDSVRAVITGVVRQAARAGMRPELAGKKHLTVEQLKEICRSLGDSPVDMRDRVVLLVGFVSALRRSDLSRLDASQVHFDTRVRLWVPFSKSDQAGAGRDVFLDAATDPVVCPIRALEAWRKARLDYFGYFRGPLLLGLTPRGALQHAPLSAPGICRILQKRLQDIGENGRDYGAHSMRSGMITAADSAGANVRSIMDRTGHKSVRMVMRYIKPTRGSNPLAGVL